MPIPVRDPTRFSILTHVDDTRHLVAIDDSTKCIGEPLALYLEGCLKANRVGRDRDKPAASEILQGDGVAAGRRQG